MVPDAVMPASTCSADTDKALIDPTPGCRTRMAAWTLERVPSTMSGTSPGLQRPR